jgi:hypothetical protein
MESVSPLTPKTIKRLKQVVAYFREETRRLNMSTWGIIIKDFKPEMVDSDGKTVYCHLPHGSSGGNTAVQTPPPCGTAACLAGAALILAGLIKPTFPPRKKKRYGITFYPAYGFPTDTPKLAAKWLGITPLQADKLFYVVSWPTHYLAMYGHSPEQKFNALRLRVNHFIRTGE